MNDMHQLMVNQLAEIESKEFAIYAYKSYLGIKILFIVSTFVFF